MVVVVEIGVVETVDEDVDDVSDVELDVDEVVDVGEVVGLGVRWTDVEDVKRNAESTTAVTT